MNKIDIKSLSPEELTEKMLQINEKPFRAKQLFEWLHVKNVTSFQEMRNLPKDFMEKCEEIFYIQTVTCLKERVSKLDGTRKYAFSLFDGNIIESVWMKYHHGNSICISSQAGCRMGCRFCASTIGGLKRNLLPSEMLEQIYAIKRMTKEKVSNVVVMGTGEPLDNYDNLIKFIRLLTNEKGLHIGQRSITVSTCGIVPAIYKLAGEHLQITLALSLHAATDEKRQELMPVARQYKLSEVMEACQYYFLKTGRRITFEYSLVRGVNDSMPDADNLASLIKECNCLVNLIPVNPIEERNYKESLREDILKFKNKLEKNRINVTIRREMGRDIEGACGQLRRRLTSEEKEG